MKNILFTLALLISFVSFGQIMPSSNLSEICFPTETTLIIEKKVKQAEGLYIRGEFKPAIDIFTDVINTNNVDPLVKHNTMYYRAMAYKYLGKTTLACQDIIDAYWIYIKNVQYYNYPSFRNIPKNKPTYINVGWGSYLYSWGCITKKVNKMMDKGARKTFKRMEKDFKKYSHNLNW